MALVLTVSDLFLRIIFLWKMHWWHTEECQTDCRLYSGQKKHNQKMDGHILSSLMPSDLDPILRLHLVNDTIPLVSVRCQNQYPNVSTQCQFDSPPRHWISDFPEERKTAGCWHVLLLSSRSQLCYDYQSPLDCVLRGLPASSHPAENKWGKQTQVWLFDNLCKWPLKTHLLTQKLAL